MLLKQTFKTLAGAQKRAAHENAHSTNYKFVPVRCLASDGDFDALKFDPSLFERGGYVWRLERTIRGR